MKIYELGKKLNRISRTAMFIGQFFLIVALAFLPYIFIFVSRQHFIPHQFNWWICLILVGAILGLGIYLLIHGIQHINEYRKNTERDIETTQDAFDFFNYIKKKWEHAEVISYFISGASVAFSIFLFVISFNKSRNPFETWMTFESILVVLGLGVYSLMSRVLRFKILKSFNVTSTGETENVIKVESSKSIIHTIILMTIFWLIVTALYVFISEYLGAYDVVIIIWPIALCIFFAWLIVDFPFGKFSFITKNSQRIKTARISLFVVLMVVLFYLMGNGSWYLLTNYINDVAPIEVRQNAISYDSETGVYSIKASTDEPIKILQVTDVHLGGTMFTIEEDGLALDAVYALVEKTRPDMIMVTGDAVFPMPYQTLSYNNHFPLMQFCAFMNKLQIPWAFTYGNHDSEIFATFNSRELNRLFELNAIYHDDLDGYMMFSDKQPDKSSRYNQHIEIFDADGEFNRALFLLDSNAYITASTFTKYDNFHDEQIKWYEDTIVSLNEKYGRTIKSMAFFHIPMSEYATAYQLYKKNSPQVQYLFGKVGEPNEAISYPDKEDTMFEKMVEMGSTQAVFVGHDHLNNIGLKYQGIDLVYGRSIDYLAYPGIKKVKGHRGATLITLLFDSEYSIEPIVLEE